MKAYRGVK